MRWLAVGILAMLWTEAALAACTVVAPRSGEADVYLPTGRASAAVVLMDGQIVGVGAAVKGLTLDWDARSATFRGQACDVVDSSGKTVTAGLTSVGVQLGVEEVELENATRDSDEGGDDPVRAALVVADAYNPRSAVIPVQRIAGITSAVIAPHGGLVSGQAAWVELAGASQAEAVGDRSVAVFARLAGESRAGALLYLRELFEDAAEYRRNRSAFDQNRSRAYVASRLDLEALGRVLDREVPLVIEADRASDIEAILRLASDLSIRVIIDGGAEAHLLAEELAAAEVPVIVDPLVYGPGSFDAIHGRAENPAVLNAAGVTVLFETDWSTHNARTLRQVAGNAVRGGMPHDDAVAAITRSPAEVFGQDDRGRIAVGAVANVVVWSGDPLELSTRVERVWIEGRAIPLRSRQTALFERYRQLPGSPVPPLTVE